MYINLERLWMWKQVRAMERKKANEVRKIMNFVL